MEGSDSSESCAKGVNEDGLIRTERSPVEEEDEEEDGEEEVDEVEEEEAEEYEPLFKRLGGRKEGASSTSGTAVALGEEPCSDKFIDC